jgi:tyrosyl-DNA phosphodiesterase 2
MFPNSGASAGPFVHSHVFHPRPRVGCVQRLRRGEDPPPSDFYDTEAEGSPPLPVGMHLREPERDIHDVPIPLHAVRYSSRKRRWALASNFAIGVREPLPSSIRLVTWNVDFASPDRKKRFFSALCYIQKYAFGCHTVSERPEPCCILFQEVHVSVFTQILDSEWVRRYFIVVPTGTDKWPDHTLYGNVTLVSRTIPVVNAFTIVFSKSDMHRTGIFVDVKLSIPALEDEPRLSAGIVTLRIANTHLESLSDGAKARPGQLRLIAHALREHGLLGGIVAGDMNDVPIVKNVGLCDAWQGDDDDEGYTWGYQPAQQFPPGRLDKVLSTRQEGFIVDKPERIGIGEAIEQGGWVSDHYGLLTRVHIVHDGRDQQANSRSVARYGKDFWGDGTTNRTPRRQITCPPPPSPRRHNLFDILRFTSQPVETSQTIPLHPRRWNFSLFTRPGRTSTKTIDVAPARDEDRYGTVPPTEAEMVAAMQQAGGNAGDSSTSQGQAITGAQCSQVHTTRQTSHATQLPNSSPDTGLGESPLYVIGCCGLLFRFGCHRST